MQLVPFYNTNTWTLVCDMAFDLPAFDYKFEGPSDSGPNVAFGKSGNGDCCCVYIGDTKHGRPHGFGVQQFIAGDHAGFWIYGKFWLGKLEEGVLQRPELWRKFTPYRFSHDLSKISVYSRVGPSPRDKDIKDEATKMAEAVPSKIAQGVLYGRPAPVCACLLLMS
eukprot:m.35274 g.35274  ORF g.35274 m.35274 type:complete len:166 (+) comp8864_c0_seq2:313-810(+)